MTALANSAGGTPSANTRSNASAQSFARTVAMISRFSATSWHNMPTVSRVDQVADDDHVRLGYGRRFGSTSAGDWPSAAL